jgi:signal transduction histidine kinase
MNPELLELAQTCKSSTENVIFMVSNILDYLKMRNGCLNIHLSAIDPLTMVKNIIRTYAIKAQQRHVKLTLIVNQAHPLPSLLLLDQSKLT